eukprot:14191717-Heterocapsa_arctica.AAC.1
MKAMLIMDPHPRTNCPPPRTDFTPRIISVKPKWPACCLTVRSSAFSRVLQAFSDSVKALTLSA